MLTNSSLLIRVQMRGEGGSYGVSANECSCAHHMTWSPNKLWKSTSILNLWWLWTPVCLRSLKQSCLTFLYIIIVRRGPGQNRVTWKTPSRAAFVPLQEPVAVLAILCSPHANAEQYECGHTQPLFHADHKRGITCVSKPRRVKTNINNYETQMHNHYNKTNLT